MGDDSDSRFTKRYHKVSISICNVSLKIQKQHTNQRELLLLL
ncbi:MAG: hypothetical protein BMS9Abin26_1530 [Gammaproteobacteria bacterium]|nr:MAG: hypothetical protein BMS9Abin26_1530 [Gammaproteobacteria bacterium]